MKDSSRYLLTSVVTAAVLYLGAAVAAHFAFREIAPQFSGDRAFNQKIEFLRNRGTAGAPFGLLIGSSMALSNIDSDLLEDADHKSWLNLGVWGLSLAETHRLYDVVRRDFPPREVVLTTQFFELTDEDRVQMSIREPTFHRYLEGHMGWIEEFAYRDLLESLRQRASWKSDEGNPNSIKSLVFTKTGAVPLNLFDGPGGPSRYSPFESYLGCKQCNVHLNSLCTAVRAQGIPFTVVIPPITHSSRSKKPALARYFESGRRIIQQTMNQCGGRVFDASTQGDFDDSCFVDFAHLNKQGNQVLTRWFIAWRRRLPPPNLHVTCTASGSPTLQQIALANPDEHAAQR